MANLPDDLFLIDPPDDLKQLYCAIGKAIVTWSIVERFLDMCILIIYHSYALTLPDLKEIPHSLTNKTKFVKKALKDSNVLLPFSDEGRKLMNRINVLKNDRHNLSHGMLLDIYTDSFDIQKFEYKKHTYDDKKIPIKIKDCLHLGNKFLDLANELAYFFRRRLLRQEGP